MLARSAAGEVRAVITDFGLARAIVRTSAEASLPLTEAGEIAGTPDYMAPEQVLGQEVTFATDIYALGIIIYEMVTGRRPFDAPIPFAVAGKRLLEPPPVPSRYAPRLDP